MLAFVVWRLLAERIAVVFVVCELVAVNELSGLPELVVGGLADGDARSLLASAIPGRLDERVRDQIVAETRGNPLALLELTRGLTPAELAGGFGLPHAPPLPDRIEDSFRRRLAPLPAPTRELLLASDGFSEGESDPPDYVATYTPAARLCDMLTPRPHVGRALDVGTGNGVHALLAASHADRAVATDVNERALAFTALNAALNDLDNVETRSGSLFEPVAGDEFGLIT